MASPSQLALSMMPLMMICVLLTATWMEFLIRNIVDPRLRRIKISAAQSEVILFGFHVLAFEEYD